MRAIWSGSLSFGLVNIPVRLYSGTNDRGGISFDLLRKNDLSPINYVRIARKDGKEVPYEDIVKGYEYKKGDYVVFTEEDFKKVDRKKTKTIDIQDFVKEQEIDPIYFEKPYFIEPEKGAGKPYALLRDAIKKSKKVAVAKFVLRNREHLGIIMPEGDLLVLEQLRFSDELRAPNGLELPSKNTKASAKEIDMALALINQLTEGFNPKEYKDEYSAELKEMIEAKAKGKKPKLRGGKTPKNTEVDQLMAALKKSLQEHKQKQAA